MKQLVFFFLFSALISGLLAQDIVTERLYGASVYIDPSCQSGVRGPIYAESENSLVLENVNAPGLSFYLNGATSPTSVMIKGQRVSSYSSQDRLTLKANEIISTLRISKQDGSLLCNLRVEPQYGFPKEKILPSFSQRGHGVRSGSIAIKDSKTFYIPNLYYDGKAPDAFFLVGKGQPSAQGTKVPDENGSYSPLKAYNGRNVTIVLPGDLTVYDIDFLSMYCISYTENFGEVYMPRENYVVPPFRAYAEQNKKVMPLDNGATGNSFSLILATLLFGLMSFII